VTSATSSLTRPARGWAVMHPVRAVRALLDGQAARADAEALAAGLTVEVLGRGVRRYRDPRLDVLAAGRWSTPTLYGQPATHIGTDAHSHICTPAHD
jgi:hypothetical protein